MKTADEQTGTMVIEDDAAATGEAPEGTEEATPPEPAKIRKHAGRLQRFWRMGAGVWAGLIIIAVGFGLIAFTWGEVAALVDVSLQLPYVVSGGLTGIGLILLGLLVINLSVKRREAIERSRQLEEIREALVNLRAAVEDEPDE